MFALTRDPRVLSLSCCLSQLCSAQASAGPASWWHFLGLWCLLCKGSLFGAVLLWWLIVLFSRGKEHFASGLQGQRGAPLVSDVPVGQKCLCGGCQGVFLSLLLVCCAVLLLEHSTGFPQQRLLVLCSPPYPAPRVIAQFPHSELKSLYC